MKTFTKAAAVLLAAGALSGCAAVDEITGESGTNLFDEALESARAAETVHAVAHVNGQKTIDMRFVRDRGAVGVVDQVGVKIDVLVVDGEGYTKTARADLEAGGADDAMAKKLGGRWLTATEVEARQLLDVTDMDRLFEDVLEDGEGRLDKGDEREVDGVQTLELKAADGSIFVTTGEDPQLVKLVADDDDDSYEMSFSDWNEPVELRAPKNALDSQELLDEMRRG